MNDGARAVKVGDVVAWADVPDGTLVFWNGVHKVFAVRFSGYGCWRSLDLPWRTAGADWPWGAIEAQVIIVATGLTGRETAKKLREIAEVFEVRQTLCQARELSRAISVEGLDWSAARLHSVGWRPGMTAEDAARLLAAPDADDEPRSAMRMPSSR